MSHNANDNTSKPQIYIWGLGTYVESVFEAIILSKCHIIGVIERKNFRNKKWKDIYPIFHIESVPKDSYDYIIVSIKNYSIIDQDIDQYKIDRRRIIYFWNENQMKNMHYLFIHRDKYLIASLQQKMKELERQNYLLHRKLENLPYEMGMEQTPKIRSAEELLDKLKKGRVSLCRFGDGEFELIRMKSRPCFQIPVELLAERLRQIIVSREERICVAVADNFGNLDKYVESAADIIRLYMTKETRTDIVSLIGYEREYYDAYVSRPYIMYKDKTYAPKIFATYQELFKGRDIVLVEGKGTRNGVGNDLFFFSNSVCRIICPDKNAFSKYSEILATVKKYAKKEDLILITLGPTATVLAYDLAMEGYQALDYGQLDNEYEWYRMGVEERCDIPGKTVSEVYNCQNVGESSDEEYRGQIICKIE